MLWLYTLLYMTVLCICFFLIFAFFIAWTTKVATHKSKKVSPLVSTKSSLALLILLPMVGGRDGGLVCNVLDYVYSHKYTVFLFESRFGQHSTMNGFC